MRKYLIPLVLSLTLLCGCSRGAEESFARFIGTVAAAEDLSFTAEVRAEYDDRTLSFKLGYEQDAEGAVIEVVEPELIAGIKARVKSDAVTLEYDGALLDLGSLTGDGISPLSSLPLLIETLHGSHIEMTWEENGLLAARLIPRDGIAVTLYITDELIPVSAEISSGEKTVVFINISDWELK